MLWYGTPEASGPGACSCRPTSVLGTPYGEKRTWGLEGPTRPAGSYRNPTCLMHGKRIIILISTEPRYYHHHNHHYYINIILSICILLMGKSGWAARSHRNAPLAPHLRHRHL